MARELLFRLALLHPEIAIVWADSAYAKNGLVPWAKKYLDITIETVRRPQGAKGFVVFPRRWAVERSWAWITRARRHCRDHEHLPEMTEALITWAAITLTTRRLTRRRSHPAERRDIAHGYVMPEAACPVSPPARRRRAGRTAGASAGTPAKQAGTQGQLMPSASSSRP